MSNIVSVNSQTYPSPSVDSTANVAVANQSSGFSYMMGQVKGANTALTPSLATSLMQRSMTTGVPTSEFDQYGGYSAVKAMFDANGGSYSLDAIPSSQRQQFAQQIAATGTGNMSLLMNKNGVDSAPIVQKIQLAQVEMSRSVEQLSAAEFMLTPTVATNLMHRSMSTGVPTSEMVSYGGYDAVKAMYDSVGGSYATQEFTSAEKQTLAEQVATSGIGNFALPIDQGIKVSNAALQTMRDNGIDQATLNKIELAMNKTQISSSSFAPVAFPFVDTNSFIDSFMGVQKQDSKA
jgi:hypothetical protein